MKKLLLTLALCVVSSNALAWTWTITNNTSKDREVSITPYLWPNYGTKQIQTIPAGGMKTFNPVPGEEGYCITTDSIMIDKAQFNLPAEWFTLKAICATENFTLKEVNGKLQIAK